MPRPEDISPAPLQLPFHLPTVMVSLGRRWPALLAIAALAGGAGAGAATLLGRQTFDAETVLHYRPVSSGRAGSGDQAIQSFLSEVKVAPNLEEVRKRLELPCSLARLGASIDVKVAKNTTVMAIKSSWADADTAAAIANTLRDVFLATWFQSGIREVEFLHRKTKPVLLIGSNRKSSRWSSF